MNRNNIKTVLEAFRLFPPERFDQSVAFYFSTSGRKLREIGGGYAVSPYLVNDKDVKMCLAGFVKALLDPLSDKHPGDYLIDAFGIDANQAYEIYNPNSAKSKTHAKAINMLTNLYKTGNVDWNASSSSISKERFKAGFSPVVEMYGKTPEQFRKFAEDILANLEPIPEIKVGDTTTIGKVLAIDPEKQVAWIKDQHGYYYNEKVSTLVLS